MRFLVIEVARYDVSDSKHIFVEAEDHGNAFIKAAEEAYPHMEMDVLAWHVEKLQQVSDEFACAPLDEIDILIYKV